MAGGYIKLHRKLLEWGWYSDANTFRVFMHLLLTASYEENEFRGHKLKPGQTVIGRKRLAKDLKMSEQSVRTALQHLISTNEITIKSTNKFTIVTIENWGKYQVDMDGINQQISHQANQQSTNNQPTTNHTQEGKEGKKVKKGKNIYIGERYGEFENVFLTDDEYTKLVERFPMDYQERIENLSTYLKQTGKRYKSHYATILSWDRKDKRQTAKTMSKGESEMKAFYGMAEEWAKES